MHENEILIYAKSWIKEAGERIKKSFQTTLNIETKSNANDLVTNIDKETEQFFITKINQQFPEHRILGEEGNGDELEELGGVVWIIDPIDGTMNFVHQQRNFAISIGIYENGVGKIGLIYDVVHDELYHAVKGKGAHFNDKALPKLNEVSVSEAIIGLNATWVTPNRRIDPLILGTLVRDVRGTRSYGSAAIEIAQVAAGRLDAYITMRLSPWDFAAGLILMEEVGGVSTTLKGEPIQILQQNSIFISKPGLHKSILENYLQGKEW
ncbi:inositol monophosphatase family protein [Robertmurraya kyonggiensis]|uniref:Inositol monophosphatase family protein n=1 Tax=Robertmurraya kyonggiensis TaxID=1037680 RepID=A0A4U1D7E5_9BACI|nr:inositol monophosphatase family protein [Robertmurraya kyonggiensis]TKC18515.1 inositol monophosphatase family protein [Robertmurraya kyonggiensis]